MDLMQRKMQGELKALRVVRVPSVEVEDQRRLTRERSELLTEKQRLCNQLLSLLFLQGYREVPAAASVLKGWLAERTEVDPQLREELERDIWKR